jgi:long-chain fatty acid transport protein
MTRLNPIAVAVSSALCALFPSLAHASGFALIEQNASGLGNAYAGQAASAQDASTIYYNPAGLTQLAGRQVVVVGNFITPSARFTNSGSSNAMLQTSAGGDGGDAGSTALVPTFYYAMDVRPDIKFGLSVGAPFGLKTDYGQDWMGRFQAVKSDLKTININPSLAYKASDSLSLGLGLDIMQVKAELTSMTNYSAGIYLATGGAMTVPNLSGLGTVKGDDWGFGANVGLLYQPQPDTRVGFSYRSEVSATLEGTATFANRPAALAAALPDGPVTAKVTLPASASLSLFKTVSPKVDLLADISWTGWSSFKDLTVVRTNGTMLSTTNENWRDTMRYSLGLNYHQNDRLTWRTGVAYDKSPVPDANRTPRIPDQDRTWLAVGVQYKLNEKAKIDAGYAHLIVSDASINSGDSVAPSVYPYGHLKGEYANHVDILSVQYSHNF